MIKIIKEGTVVFGNGKIVAINGFEVDCKDCKGNFDSLRQYVEDNYIFKGKKDN